MREVSLFVNSNARDMVIVFSVGKIFTHISKGSDSSTCKPCSPEREVLCRKGS